MSPYVLTMRADGDKLEVSTMTLFAREKTATLDLKDLRPKPEGTKRPFVSFLVGERPLFVHNSVFKDKKLLEHLLGRKLTEEDESG